MIRYRPLFQVDISHDYFLSRGETVFEAQPDVDRAALTELYSVENLIEIVPDETSRARLAGHRMIFRPTPSGFLVAVQLDPSATDIRPAIVPASDFRLTFGLRIKDSRFSNYTEVGPVTTGFYRFGNHTQNRVAGVNYLSRRIPVFDATRQYVAGEIRAQAAGATFNLFLALRDTGPSATPTTGDWRRIPADTWSSTTTYQTGAIVLFANRVFRALVDAPGTDLDDATEWQVVRTLGNQYVSVSDATLPLPDRVARASGWFGIIDIELGTADFALFNSNGTLRSPRYVLRFLNRATRWRYIFPTAQAVGPGAEVAPEAGDNRILVTASVRPLTRFGAGSRLQADSAATPAVSEEVLLPAPEIHRIRRQNAEWFSETHLPNLTLG